MVRPPLLMALLLATPGLFGGCSSAFDESLSRARDLYAAGQPAKAREMALDLAKRAGDDDEAVAVADLLLRVDAGKEAADLLRERELEGEGRAVLADAWFAAGDRTRASLALEAIEKADEVSGRSLLVAGKLSLSRADPAGAARNLERSLERDDSDPLAWSFLGYAWLAAGDAARGERLLRDARTRFPDSPEVALMLATVVLRARPDDAGAMKEAADLMVPAVERRPLDRASRTTLANLLRRLGRLPEAEQALEAITAAWPDDPAAFGDLGAVRMDRGRTREAVDAFRRAAELAPLDRAGLLNLGYALLALADVEFERAPAAREADEVFRRAMRVAATEPRVYVGLARAAVKIDPGSNELAAAARQHYLKALQFDPGNFEANLGIAVLYYDLWAKLGEEKGEGRRKARAHFEKAAEKVPPSQWSSDAQKAFDDVRK